MWRERFRAGLCATALLLGSVLASGAHAIPVLGVLNITGSMSIGSSSIDFLPVLGGTGAFAVDPFTQTLSFATLGGTSGLIKDLSSAGQPTGVAFSLPDWLTFAAAPGLGFTLEFISPGVFGSASCGAAPAAGQVCTPVGSAFSFVNLSANSSVLSFQVSGVVPGTAGELSPFSGVFTAQFAGLSYQSVLAALASGGSVAASYSANFEVIPEPASLSLVLLGLAVLSARGRSRA